MAKKKPSYGAFVNVRCLREARTAMKRMVAELQGVDELRFRGKPISQDALIMAGWLWLDELGAAVVARELAKHVSRLDRIVASKEAAKALDDSVKSAVAGQKIGEVELGKPAPLAASEKHRPAKDKRTEPNDVPGRRR